MTDTIVIGLLLGPKPVAAMFLTQRLILIANAQVNSVANASWAALADLKHRAENVAFRERLVELSRLVVGVGLTISGTVAAYDGQFVKLWVGKSLYAGDLLAVLTLIQGVIFGFVLLFTWVIDTLGDSRHRTLVSSSGSVLNLILSFVFVKWIGVPGVTLGTIVAYLMTDVWYCPFIAVRRYGVPARLLCRGLGRGVALGGAWAVFCVVRITFTYTTTSLGWLYFRGADHRFGIAGILLADRADSGRTDDLEPTSWSGEVGSHRRSRRCLDDQRIDYRWLEIPYQQ